MDKHRVRKWYVAKGVDEGEISFKELEEDKEIEPEASRGQGPLAVSAEDARMADSSGSSTVARGTERIVDGERSPEEVNQPK